MNTKQIGTVKALYRYPVKSMLGEELSELELGAVGVVGDRAYALREGNGDRIVSAKRTTHLLDFTAWYGKSSQTDVASSLQIRLPNGRKIQVNDPNVNKLLSEAVGRSVRLERWQSQQQNYGELDASTIFADVPIAEALEGKKRQLEPDADRFDLAPGTFFDSAHLHLLASGTLDHMQTLIGSDAQLDPRRFRPNILIDTAPSQTESGQTEFVEDAWLGGRLTIGHTVQIVELWPTLRCVMTTLPQADLVKDVRILKTAVIHNNNHLGVFASVGTPGIIKVGDPVMLTM